MPTLPGPTSQTPLLQAKFVVIRVGGAVAAAADAAAPRLAATSDAVISRALSGDRMTTSPGRRNGRCPRKPGAVTAPGRGPSQIPAGPYHSSLDGHWRPSNGEIPSIPAKPDKSLPGPRWHGCQADATGARQASTWPRVHARIVASIGPILASA